MSDLVWENISSSHLAAAAYDSDEQTLYIKFTNNSTYKYFNVPFEVFEELCSISSAGTYFHSRIRGQFRYEKV